MDTLPDRFSLPFCPRCALARARVSDTDLPRGGRREREGRERESGEIPVIPLRFRGFHDHGNDKRSPPPLSFFPFFLAAPPTASPRAARPGGYLFRDYVRWNALLVYLDTG